MAQCVKGSIDGVLLTAVITLLGVDNEPGGSGEGCGEGLREVGHEAEGEFAGDEEVDQLEDDEAVDEEAYHDRHEVLAQLTGHFLPTVHFQHLGRHQEEDTDGRQPSNGN